MQIFCAWAVRGTGIVSARKCLEVQPGSLNAEEVVDEVVADALDDKLSSPTAWGWNPGFIGWQLE